MRKAVVIFVLCLALSTGLYQTGGCFDQTGPRAGSGGTSGYDLKSVAYNNGIYVAVGDSGVILNSTNVTHWTTAKSGTNSDLKSVVWGNGQFVAVGENGIVLASPDGRTWTGRVSGYETSLSGIAWNGQSYVAVGDNGTVLKSDDGNRWERVRMATGENLLGVEWQNNRYIAVGSNMVILASTDGITWDTYMAEPIMDVSFTSTAGNESTDVIAGDQLKVFNDTVEYGWQDISDAVKVELNDKSGDRTGLDSVIWGRNEFVAVGESGAVLVSKDGIDWSLSPRTTDNRLMDVVWSDRYYVAVGDKGTIIVSGDGVNWSDLTEAGLNK